MAERLPCLKSDDLSALLPYLSEGFCNSCKGLLEARLCNLSSDSKGKSAVSSHGHHSGFCSAESASLSLNGRGPIFSPQYVTSKANSRIRPASTMVPLPELSNLSLNEKETIKQVIPASVRISEQSEFAKMSQVCRKKDFLHMERVYGRNINILQGLELHTGVFSVEEQQMIVEYVYDLQRQGRSGQLKERTYTEPEKWMRGKGRVTIQFGCCYNYVVDRHGNQPGIVRDEDVDPMPSLLKLMIKKLVKWHVVPPTCIPNSCIINIYDEGDCIPPHIDHHDFVRPFCTVSFLTECNILFGMSLKIAGPGEFTGPVSIPLPVGSVLILNGNGADVAKHCVPGVPGKRISITFRKMDGSKLPYNFALDPELEGLQPLVRPLVRSPSSSLSNQRSHPSYRVTDQNQPLDDFGLPGRTNSSLFQLGNDDYSSPFQLRNDDFPPLGQDDFPTLGQSMWRGNRPRSRNYCILACNTLSESQSKLTKSFDVLHKVKVCIQSPNPQNDPSERNL